nr:MAG TPA_asm: hypothetical protein [Caudoviricetes sp.]
MIMSAVGTKRTMCRPMSTKSEKRTLITAFCVNYPVAGQKV